MDSEMELDDRIKLLVARTETLDAKIDCHVRKLEAQIAHHDHMGGVYQTRILRLEEALEKLQSTDE